MALAPNDQPQNPSQISDYNRQVQLDEERIQGNSTIKPQRLETHDVPLFVHHAGISPVIHPQHEQNDRPANLHPGVSPTQSPNDGGRRSAGAA